MSTYTICITYFEATWNEVELQLYSTVAAEERLKVLYCTRSVGTMGWGQPYFFTGKKGQSGKEKEKRKKKC